MNYGRLGFISQNSIPYHPEPEEQGTTRTEGKIAVAADSTTLQPENRRQEEATCSGTTGRGTLQRLQTLGLRCQEAPVETTRENLGQSVAWSNLL